MISGCVVAAADIVDDEFGDLVDVHRLQPFGMGVLEVEARAHDDACRPDARAMRASFTGSRPMPKLVASTTVWPPSAR